MKRTLFKAGLCAAAASALFFNEKKWENRLLKERADFDIQKEILLNKINLLENRDTSFRFYEHFANGADYKTIKAIEQRTFVRPQNNIYAQYRPKALSAEVIENNYAAMAKNLHDSDLEFRRRQALEAFQNSDSVPDILENGSRFMQATLDMMSKHNHAMGGSLARAIKNSDAENERELKARYLMFEMKTKHKMYFNRHDLSVDFYRIVFLKNLSLYKQTAKFMTSLTDSLENNYLKKVQQDSLLFEREKRRQIDSIIKEKPRIPLLKYNFADQMPTPFHFQFPNPKSCR